MSEVKNRDAPVLYVVIPCYNEDAVIEETATQLKAKIDELKKNATIAGASRVIFIDDGSRDATWKKISDLQSKYSDTFGCISLAGNMGHQNALLAGLMTARQYADIVISMDADLQDDIRAIEKMLVKYSQGFDVVYGVRVNRDSDTFFKRFTAESFYRLMSAMGTRVVYNHADYRLMSKRALNALAEYKEVNLFLRGIIPLIGFKSTTVEYGRNERYAGTSKYPLRKMLAFALEGITSFSVRPIRIVTILGSLILVIGFILSIYSLIQYLSGNTVQGWTSVLVSLWLIGGALMISMGIVGEYVGKIYLETKARPRYIIDEVLIDKK